MAEITDLNSHLQKILKAAKFEDKLAKGLHEVCKALEATNQNNTKAHLCILANDCNEEKYKLLITSLCKQYKIPILKVDSRKELGEWIGLCKFDSSNTARKVRGCSSVVIKEFSESEEIEPSVKFVRQKL